MQVLLVRLVNDMHSREPTVAEHGRLLNTMRLRIDIIRRMAGTGIAHPGQNAVQGLKNRMLYTLL